MNLFKFLNSNAHEQLIFCNDPSVNLKAIIAIHNSRDGLAMGGTRMLPYASDAEAIQDVLRLSRGMTYKAAAANIPVGGAKGIIIAEPNQKTDAQLKAYGRFVNRLNGCFVTGQDVNLTPRDVQIIGSETPYVVGGLQKSGGPAQNTSTGVLLGIKAAVKFLWPGKELKGLRVAVQGLGNTGKALCQHLYDHEVEIFACDLDSQKEEEIRNLYGATIVDRDKIYSLDVDVFSPCALGGILNGITIPQLRASIIAGSANNQLEDEERDSYLLQQKGILYCPDYVINSGGLINVYNEMIGYNETNAKQMLVGIYETLHKIFKLASLQEITPCAAAYQIAHGRFRPKHRVRNSML